MASTRSQSAVLLDGPAPPRIRVAPSSRANSWEDVSDLAASLGVPLDEWQDTVFEAAMGERANGKWASKFVGLSAPRQNGKSQLIVARALAGVLLFGEKMIIISSYETDTAREVWKRLVDVIEDNPTLEARVTGRMDAINREFISFGKGKDKQTIKLKARRASGSRGFSADCLLLDEGQILGKAAWGSIVPTMSARTNVTPGGPQLWLFGTPPTSLDDPFAFARVRESAMAKKARHCWLEWSADPADDFDDEATWAKSNPAYGTRLTREAVADDRAAMDDEQFAMERLGIWDTRAALSVFGAGRWEACAGEEVKGLPLGALSVAADRDLTRFGVVGAALDGDVTQVKPLFLGPSSSEAVEFVAGLHEAHGAPVAVDGRGPAAALIPDLERAGVNVVTLKTPDVLDACSGVFTAVSEKALRHANYPDLNAAVDSARKRDVGDRWAWGRKGDDHVVQLEAATFAHWLLTRPQEVTESAYADHDLIII